MLSFSRIVTQWPCWKRRSTVNFIVNVPLRPLGAVVSVSTTSPSVLVRGSTLEKERFMGSPGLDVPKILAVAVAGPPSSKKTKPLETVSVLDISIIRRKVRLPTASLRPGIGAMSPDPMKC
jgi:hypothetical protein